MAFYKYNNKLINEKSPYLLQHAHNPVNWFPWGEEAFEKAKTENKPIFLSIGYSTCHWCHVMERESFEDLEVAEILNKHFISIKVDKEERPDIDAVYMRVCQAMTGSGGWPLTIIMTPSQQPFFAGTYFPKNSRFNILGLLDLLKACAQQWGNNREQLIRSSNQIVKAVQTNGDKQAEKLSIDIIIKAKIQFVQSFDDVYGGFGTSPKFPSPHNLMFLLRLYKFDNDERCLLMVEKTLRQMYRGGIFDHIGFGFSRYSTDDKWLVPHFEKMLYDNALLLAAYLETYQITKDDFYKMTAEKIIDYIFREMTDESGGFYCAQDADSEGQEGKFYVFTQDEIKDVLGADDGEKFIDYFGVTPNGNFEGKNILNLLNNDSYDKHCDYIESLIPKLYDYRLTRTKLHKDDKILTSWNALMVTALAKAYEILGETKYLNAAEKGMKFILSSLTDKNGGMLVSYRNGKASGTGGLDDYAYTVWALLSLYKATFTAEHLKNAVSLNNEMVNRFWDNENGGFYLSAENAEKLIYRPKETYDGAIPSGNSVAAYCLIKLSAITADVKLQEIADIQLRFLANEAEEYPSGFSFALISILNVLNPSMEIVCALSSEDDLQKLKQITRKKFLPNTTILVKDEKNSQQIENIAEYTKECNVTDDKSTFYICENRACSQPIHDFSQLEKRLT